MAAMASKTDFGKHDAVVYNSGDFGFHAFILRTSKFFDLDAVRYYADGDPYATRYTTKDFEWCAPTYPSPVAINVDKDTEEKHGCALTLDGYPFERYGYDYGYQTHPIFLNDFGYTFQYDNVHRMGPTTEDWATISKLPLDVVPKSTAVFNENIILLYDKQENTSESDKAFEVYSFSTSNFRTQKLATWNDCTSAVTFYYSGNLHILTGRGDLWRIDDTDQVELSLDRCHYGENTDQYNWDIDIPLCGAVVYGKELIVFSNKLPHDQPLPKLTFTEFGLTTLKVKFMQIVADGNCHYVRLPESWLKVEI